MYTDLITVVMSSSAIPSHPSTEIVDRVLAGIEFHLLGVKTMLMCDGIRVPEHENRREGYEDYKNRMRVHSNVKIVEWYDSVQQAFMTREVLRYVTTPFVLWNEHDYLLVHEPIDWEGIINVIQQGIANVVRMHNGDEIHPLHQHLILDGIFEGADGYHGAHR